MKPIVRCALVYTQLSDVRPNDKLIIRCFDHPRQEEFYTENVKCGIDPRPNDVMVHTSSVVSVDLSLRRFETKNTIYQVIEFPTGNTDFYVPVVCELLVPPGILRDGANGIAVRDAIGPVIITCDRVDLQKRVIFNDTHRIFYLY